MNILILINMSLSLRRASSIRFAFRGYRSYNTSKHASEGGKQSKIIIFEKLKTFEKSEKLHPFEETYLCVCMYKGKHKEISKSL